MGLRPALLGVVATAVAILAVTLSAAVWPELQGILLTVLTLDFFIAVMMLLPNVRASENNF
jgi:hypothetical protein